jgi:hypothetical protein
MHHWHMQCSGPVRWRSALRNTIYDVLLSKKDWVETESETEWDFFWADKGCGNCVASLGAHMQTLGAMQC